MINFIKNFKFLRSNKNITFFSEGGYQWKFFENFILDILNNTNLDIVFLTSEKNDPAFNLKNEKFKVIFIGKGLFRITFLNFIKTKFLFTSTPDLGSSKFKKSPFIEKYVYIPHSIGSTHLTYNEKAFDNFDVILCAGKIHHKEIQKREEKFKLKKKELVPFGYPWITNLKKKLEISNKDKKNINKNVLYAPSWGKNSSLEFVDTNLISYLLKIGCKVYFKPHPMSFSHNKKAIKKIEQEFLADKNFFLKNLDDIFLIRTADLLITDWSGISFEYFFVKRNPKIIFLDTPIRAINKNYKDLELETIEEKYRNDMGIIANLDFVEIKKKVDIALKTETDKNLKNSKIENDILFNYDKCINNLLEILKK